MLFNSLEKGIRAEKDKIHSELLSVKQLLEKTKKEHHTTSNEIEKINAGLKSIKKGKRSFIG